MHLKWEQVLFWIFCILVLLANTKEANPSALTLEKGQLQSTKEENQKTNKQTKKQVTWGAKYAFIKNN